MPYYLYIPSTSPLFVTCARSSSPKVDFQNNVACVVKTDLKSDRIPSNNEARETFCRYNPSSRTCCQASEMTVQLADASPDFSDCGAAVNLGE